jgi:2-(1,2-epoxy-1,2-dihydrophenyl)acetyl-CoA isomerase
VLGHFSIMLPHSDSVPGALTAGDLCDLAGSLAPRPLRLEAMVDHLNRPLSAAEALQAGLVSEVTPDAGLAERVRTLAAELADGPTAAYATARRLLRAGLQTDYAEHLGAEAVSIVGSFTTEDGLEGVRAFRERRRPQFHGG